MRWGWHMVSRPGRLAREAIAVAGLTVVTLQAGAVGQEEVGPDREAMTAIWPGISPDGSVVLPNGWSLKPSGAQVPLAGDFPVLMARHPSEPVLAVLFAGYREHEVVTIDAGSNRVIGRVALPRSFSGLVWSPGGDRLFVGGGFDDLIYRFEHDGGLLSGKVEIRYPGPLVAADPPPGNEQDVRRTGQRVPGGLALSGDGKTLWVANVWGDTVAKFDAETGALLGEFFTGVGTYPYGLAIDETRGRVYASLWGASAVMAFDLESGDRVARWETEEHPNELLLAREGKILYVANANRNTVSVIDADEGRTLETIGTAIAPDAPAGSTPNALALSPDESVLFVSNANTNHVAVVNVEQPGRSRSMGFLPVGWYPTCVRLSEDGKTIYVSNGKGAMSRSNRQGPQPTAGPRPPTVEYIGGLFEGTLSVIPMPTPDRMAELTRTVYECSPIDRERPAAVTAERPEGNPIPAQVGEPSPIKYCIYIVKENRTYDQVFGDIPEGKGAPELCLFPEEVTPNHHALAREFVLLDNFYVESEVSADGHEWTMAAYATDFVERTWPLGYRGDRRVPYPSEGNFAIARPAGGYLWDRAREAGVSYRSYGEFIRNGPTPDAPGVATVETLEGHFDPFFRSYDLSYPDVKRAERFLEELARFEKEGEMPQLMIVRLPNDHTAGTRVGGMTPRAMVADNDLALGMLVEGVSKSKFWPETAIFVVEDDAQNGPDHVDAHRTVALCISPYTRGTGKDSTMYSTSSMLRTMELILGLEPMSQFDAAARPMYASFRPEADPRPYDHLPARIDLEEVNLPTAWGAELSERLDLTREDAADDLLFNEIIWRSVKGADSPMPAPVRSAFVLQVEGDDEDEEDEDGDDE
ncbi:bifunctional YncE family protein/alkaline phosphatase family protein [Tautonia sp. JC769]|uniref:bifunctional YncE family protein/alkaline phosphatase family protein n=1 Tax=Tautonia sp. JC769 TaxID=3232135 RepID=UPI0034589B2F